MTPLHCACEEDNLSVVQYLLKKGVNIEAKDKWHQLTPLHIALSVKNLPIQYLLKKGAN